MNQDQLEDMALNGLMHHNIITSELIREITLGLRTSVMFKNVTDEQVEEIIKKLEERCSITMTIGDGMAGEEYVPWFDAAKVDIDWHYWPKYRKLLEIKNFAPKVIASIDSVTDRIVGFAENPKKQGAWERKGMVVGHVQSGKTANYIGLISKAADAGYKVFIVIAGMTNNLRKQTQMRIEEGFTGYDTSDNNRKPIGVGRFDNEKRPITFTTANKDFNKQLASQVGANLKDFNAPVVFVIKKSKQVLENLIDWLQQSKQLVDDQVSKIDDVPMMLIDDEADNASINTKKNPNEASLINALIRRLLNQFNKRCYIGYTATPFANIFIDDAHIEGIGGDLFPRDFIWCLDAPSNYVGANEIFGPDKPKDIVRIIEDNEEKDGKLPIFPLSHKKDLEVDVLPESLIRAINNFFLVRAIRLLRGQDKMHNSMLVNVSRFNDVQKRVKDKIIEYLTDAQTSIRYSYRRKNALENEYVLALKKLFEQEYVGCEFTWQEVQGKLNDAVAPIKVYMINQSSGDSLDYNSYPDGLNVIAIGGLALSRGLTLEGLSVSYIIRNTMMYDTLMQMGRWFGYRGGYDDLCRIYMPKEAEAWYTYVTDATDELIKDFKYMASINASPKNFGLRVRKNPFNLLITAQNKMRHGVTVREKADLSGRYKETSRVFVADNELRHNQTVFYNTITKLQMVDKQEKTVDGAYIWKNVSPDIVLDFVRDYKNHESAMDTQTSPVHRFIKHLKEYDKKDKWDVALVSLEKDKPGKAFELPIEQSIQIKIREPERTAGRLTADGKGIEVSSRRRVASQGVEKLGLTKEQQRIAEASQIYKDGDIDRAYRLQRSNPLLVLFLIKLKKNDKTQIVDHVPAYGISFPEIERDYVYEGEEYLANIQYIKEMYGEPENDEEDEYVGDTE